MKCVAFKPLERGSLQGFADLAMDSGLILVGCTLHESNGKRWVNPPGRPQLDTERKPITDGGKVVYAPVVEFASKSLRSRWSSEACAAIGAFLESTTPGSEPGAVNGKSPTAASLGARRE